MTERQLADRMMFGGAGYPAQGQPLGKMPGLLMGDIVLIVITGLALLAVFMFWAKFLRNRKARRKKPQAQRVYRDPEQPEVAEEAENETPDSRRRYKYRWKRRRHRKRNPTLSETGGLPSARADEAESP